MTGTSAEAAALTPEAVLGLLASRRVVREFTSAPVSDQDLVMILEAGRWASSASNNRIHRFLVVREPGRIELVRTMSPGMLAGPTALVVICTDLKAVAEKQIQLEKEGSSYIDVGTASMNMMVQAHALDLGSCPTTSFSKPGVATMLELPDHIVPEYILQLGHPARPLGRPAPISRPVRPGRWVRENTSWERFGVRRTFNEEVTDEH